MKSAYFPYLMYNQPVKNDIDLSRNIAITGPNASGKTTILNYLHKHKNIQIDLEPVDKWKPFLDNIYLSKTGYFNFQIKV